MVQHNDSAYDLIIGKRNGKGNIPLGKTKSMENHHGFDVGMDHQIK